MKRTHSNKDKASLIKEDNQNSQPDLKANMEQPKLKVKRSTSRKQNKDEEEKKQPPQQNQQNGNQDQNPKKREQKSKINVEKQLIIYPANSLIMTQSAIKKTDFVIHEVLNDHRQADGDDVLCRQLDLSNQRKRGKLLFNKQQQDSRVNKKDIFMNLDAFQVQNNDNKKKKQKLPDGQLAIPKDIIKDIKLKLKEKQKQDKQKQKKSKKKAQQVALAVQPKKKDQNKARAPPRNRQKIEEDKDHKGADDNKNEMIKVQNHNPQKKQNHLNELDQLMQPNNEEEKQGVDIDQNNDKKKRNQKAKGKQQAKAKKQAKKNVAVEPRQDVNIPDTVQQKFSDKEELFINCCQTCSNRNCIRAVNINSTDLFIHCVKSRAHISSLIEQLSPEIRICALEQAILLNRHEIVEILLSQEKNEQDYRMKKRGSQIAKFETGEVGKMAFGFKVRKVQMMRGNRQGNNAFIEDPSHNHQTPLDYLLNGEFVLDKCFPTDCVNKQTLQVIQKSLGAQKFEEFIKSKALPILMRHGCQKTILHLFELIGHQQNIQNNFFNRVYHQFLTVEKVEEFKITDEELRQVKLNQTVSYAHVAALNSSGAPFRFLISKNQEIDVTINHLSTAHFAAVSSNDINLKILIEQQINLHDVDEKKRTPLMWAIEAKKPVENIVTILGDINKSEKDFKDERKQMAIHYFCKFGVNHTLPKDKQKEVSDQILQNFILHKAKFSQFGGWNKYTPLIFACVYGNFEIVNFLIQNVPRINLNKGDKYNRTPLAMACRNGHAQIAALLIKYNADLDLADTSGNTPLHYAAAYGWQECVEILIQYGADPSPENAWKSTPITIALQKNHIAIVKELLKTQDINVNSKDDEGRSLLALSMANINQESIEFIDLLISQKGADVNSQDAKGCTPLYHLVQNMSNRKRGLFSDYDELEHKIVKILLASGASLNIKSKEGKSPFSIAFENGMTDLLKLFGGSIDLNEDPSLFFAFSKNSIMKISVQTLLRECMENKPVEDETLNYVNNDGFTPLLQYIHIFAQAKPQVMRIIQDMIGRRIPQIINETIIERLEKNEPQLNQFAQPGKEAEEFYQKEILKPFIQFIQYLIDSGANPNAYVLKLRQYRDDTIPQTQQPSQLSQIQGQNLARRPPEKDQYVQENLGLCNAIHLLIDQQPIRPLFDFFINIKGIQLNQVNFQKMTPFFKLVKTKDIKNDPDYKYCFEQLLKTGLVDIDSPDQFGMSAFWYFYTNNRVEEAFYLVDKGANINHIDNYGFFALKRELFASNFAMIKRLLEKGALPDTTDEFQRTILHLACDFAHRKDYKEIFQILVKHKANICALDFKSRTPIHYLFVKKNKRSLVDQFDPLNQGLELLINNHTKDQFDINHQDINGKTIIHYAAQRGSVDSLRYLIKIFGEEQIKFDLEDKFRNTPLAVALNSRHLDFVTQLINLQLCKLKGFIYEEPKQQRQQQMNQIGNLFGGGGAQHDDEQSDMEFMEIQVQQQFNNLDQAQEKRKHDKDALNLFRYIIRNQLSQIEKLFIQNEYDRIQMVVDYICEGQIGKLFQVIETHFKDHKGAKGSILIQKNEKGQNLIHVLAKNSHLIKDINEITKFYKQLVDEGVNQFDVDNKGRSALHFAIKSGNFHLIKYLVDVEKFDINQVDHKGLNAINELIKGDRILKANVRILQYLIKAGGNSDQLYYEKMYKKKIDKQNDNEELKLEENKNEQLNYKTTCVIHAIRHESKDRANIREILKELLLHSNPSLQDSEGKDAFMYSAIRNHINTFNFILDTIKEQKQNYDSISKNTIDMNGKSFIHHIVNPIAYGSYENKEFLITAIEVGFKHDIKDKAGKTPYDYALLQKSGVLKKVFNELVFNKNLIVQEQHEEEKMIDIDNLIGGNQQVQLPDVQEFEADAQNYLEQIQMQIDPHQFVPCDPSGKFHDDCIVMFDEKTQQHYDVYLTRVEIGKFQPGGDYLFYKMQLVLDKSRDLSILLTRWGRIGEEGAFQKTPYNTHEEGIDEFNKVFEQKTGNKWGPKDKFVKKWRKFQLMRTNYVTIDQKNYLLPFNLDSSPQSQILNNAGIEILREICDVNTYLKALQNSGVDPKAMPFSNLDRKNLYEALEVLQKLHKTLVKLEGMNPRPYSENERNKLLATREKMWYLSSRFYEFIPHEEFRNKMVPPISNIDMLLQKSGMIQNLIQIEVASKILLGAHFKKDTIHPLEYCIKAAGINFEVLKRESGEFKIIEEYALNTYIEQQKKQIKNIVRIKKEKDDQLFRKDMHNRHLLFHGSKVSNFLGIMAHGLRVQPLEVQRNGNLLGKGIYFSDAFSKSLQYTNDQNAPNHGSKFILVCEVALGDVKEFNRFNYNYQFGEPGVDSIKGTGRQAPDSKLKVTLPDGAVVTIGKLINQAGKENSDFQYNEYVVPESNQVRMRYLIQLK